MCKDFLKYVHCQSGFTGKDLRNEVSSFESFNFDIQNCRGQGYDSAGVVKNKWSCCFVSKGKSKGSLYSLC